MNWVTNQRNLGMSQLKRKIKWRITVVGPWVTDWPIGLREIRFLRRPKTWRRCRQVLWVFITWTVKRRPRVSNSGHCTLRLRHILPPFLADSVGLTWLQPFYSLACGGVLHNHVHLLPVYKPLEHRQPIVTHTVKKWSDRNEEALMICFYKTWWKVFRDVYGKLKVSLNAWGTILTCY